MPSLNFDVEKKNFREFYSERIKIFEDSIVTFSNLIKMLLIHPDNIPISKIDGRVKDKEECINKFNRKYRNTFEINETPYSIQDSISDLIGIRIVCLYEDDIQKIQNILTKHFDIIEVTNKTQQIESTEGSFGYKGLHLDMKLGSARSNMEEYKIFVDLPFELQIRTIIQDSWSVLDHKIKYKKSIPTPLKRRINTLAALFELADREFREIRNTTDAEIEKAEAVPLDDNLSGPEQPITTNSNLTAFQLLKIIRHFFSDFTFEDYKVDGFTQEIILLYPSINRKLFNNYMKNNIGLVKDYKKENETTNKMNPYTLIRHCLYLGDKEKFATILTKEAKDNFEQWLKVHSLYK